jgi:hypothetical protein
LVSQKVKGTENLSDPDKLRIRLNLNRPRNPSRSLKQTAMFTIPFGNLPKNTSSNLDRRLIHFCLAKLEPDRRIPGADVRIPKTSRKNRSSLSIPSRIRFLYIRGDPNQILLFKSLELRLAILLILSEVQRTHINALFLSQFTSPCSVLTH